jgi:hypothetical protein
VSDVGGLTQSSGVVRSVLVGAAAISVKETEENQHDKPCQLTATYSHADPLPMPKTKYTSLEAKPIGGEGGIADDVESLAGFGAAESYVKEYPSKEKEEVRLNEQPLGREISTYQQSRRFTLSFVYGVSS